jgi:hypothetical protein
MPTTPATGDTTARTIEDRFLDLICSDADLLAANGPSRPPPPLDGAPPAGIPAATQPAA